MTDQPLQTLVVIPARYCSSRFPGKPLADLNGKPMIAHVVNQAALARRPDKIIVATEDQRIADTVSLLGHSVAITSDKHPTGTDRVAEVAASYSAPLVVNLQGDLPLFSPAVLDRLIERGGKWITSGEADVVTLAARINSEEALSKNTVKLVHNKKGEALYFSRSPIPYFHPAAGAITNPVFFQHYGVYLYERSFLLKMAKLPQSYLETMEQLEQLRFLEEGGRIRTVEITNEEAAQFCEVNVLEDLVKASTMLKGA